jgi:glucosamine-6-phosphate deaminase
VKWVVVADYEVLSERAAQRVLSSVRQHPHLVLGLPTGRTPEGMYERIVAECSRAYHCFRDVTTFNLDEYVGITPEHPGSYHTYMRRHLLEHVDVQPGHTHIPDGRAAQTGQDDLGQSADEALRAECARYERAIAAAGGLGLTILGLGTNGHIGFNEPGTPFDSRTRVVRLTESTRKANADLFPEGDVPREAITMGIATILSSRAIVILASGPKKEAAVACLRESEPDPGFPASALRLHPDVTVIADQDAAGE